MRFYFLIVKKNGIRVSKAYIFAPLEMTVTFGRRKRKCNKVPNSKEKHKEVYYKELSTTGYVYCGCLVRFEVFAAESKNF